MSTVPKLASNTAGSTCGRRGLPAESVAVMYADYLRLKSLGLVGKLHNRSRQAMWQIFHNHGLKMNERIFHPILVTYKGRKYNSHSNRRHKYLRDTVYRKGKKALLHHVIWTEHNGPIPPGHKIIFKDGNHLNWGIENLQMVTNSEQSRRMATGENQFTKSAKARLTLLLRGGTAAGKLQRRAA